MYALFVEEVKNTACLCKGLQNQNLPLMSKYHLNEKKEINKKT